VSQGGGKKSKADIAREYMITHARQVAADAWQCGRCGTANGPGVEFCAQCGADGRGAKRIEAGWPADATPVLIVTTNEIPGYQITEVHGDVFGLVVRARNYFSNLGAQFTAVVGGEVTGYTRLLTDSRNQARERM
jgi:Putative heavy-metal-binding